MAEIEQLRAQAAGVEDVREELQSEKQISQQLQKEIEKLREQAAVHAHAVFGAAEQQRAEAAERAPKDEDEMGAQAADRRAHAALEEMQKLQSAIEDVRGELDSERLISQHRLTEIDALRENMGVCMVSRRCTSSKPHAHQ